MMASNKGTKEMLAAEPSLKDQVSKHYEKFFVKFAEIKVLPITDWKIIHILAYACQKYEDYYGLRYSFRFNHPAPSKSFEVYVIKKLANMLSCDPVILKEYLDWVFTDKIIQRKKRITSLNYFAHPDIINDYKFKFLFNKKEITRADQLPTNIVEICSRYTFNIKTYGELAFIKRMPNQDALFNALKDVGFQIDILEKIL